MSNLENVSIIPVPIGIDRWYERRFNQSDRMSNIVSEALGLKKYRYLYRFWSGEHQARLSRENRMKRKTTFWIPPRMRVPKRVVLVDDVISTGTTVNAAAKYLKSRGCQYVTVLALARSN